MAASGSGLGRQAMTTTDSGMFPESDLIAGNLCPHQGHQLWVSMSESFWVYMFKMQRCPDPTSHDWVLCPYAHKGERARRRDLRCYPYLAVACPEYCAPQEYYLLSGAGEAPTCVRGMTCPYSHDIFELWLHPKLFRTHMCDDGMWCLRKIYFFAHYAAQLRHEDDAVPVISMPRPLPRIQHPPLLPPPPRPRPRVVDMVMETRLEDMPDNDKGTSSSSAASAAAVATLASAPTPMGDSGSSSAGSSSRRAEQDSGLPDIVSVMDMLERLMRE